MSYRESHLDKSGETYDADLNNNNFDHFMQIREAELIVDFLSYIPHGNGKRYLDFACGTGRILQQITPYFDTTIAVDVSETMMKQAQKILPDVTFYLSDLTKENLDIGQFDLVSAFRFFGNAEDSLRLAVLKALRKRVKPHGFLLINNHRNPSSLLARISGDKTGMDLTYKKLKSQLSNCGFLIVKQMPIGCWMLRNRWCQKDIWDSARGKTAEKLTAFSSFAPIAPDMIILAKPQ